MTPVKEQTLKIFYLLQGKELSLDEIAAFLGFSSVYVRGLVNELTDSGAVEKVRQGRKVTYRINPNLTEYQRVQPFIFDLDGNIMPMMQAVTVPSPTGTLYKALVDVNHALSNLAVLGLRYNNLINTSENEPPDKELRKIKREIKQCQLQLFEADNTFNKAYHYVKNLITNEFILNEDYLRGICNEQRDPHTNNLIPAVSPEIAIDKYSELDNKRKELGAT